MPSRILIRIFLIFFATQLMANESPIPQRAASGRPNILLIMVDDMGYSDLGCYGSEIETPHLDRMADGGLKFRQLRNYARCCPSRASLLTGHYAHTAQLGWMTAADESRPGYRGGITRDLPISPELLRPQGYRTHMVGKWHVAPEEVVGDFWHSGLTRGVFPLDRGFDSFLGIMSGGNAIYYDKEGNRLGGGYRTPWDLVRDSTHIPVPDIPEDFFLTTELGDELVQRIRGDGDGESEEPFFIYYAPYAPHLPLEAPEDRIARTRERYRVGYEQLWRGRIDRMESLGLFPEGISADDARPHFERAWDDLSAEEKDEWVETAATFAAMVELVDEQVGRAIEVLEKTGQLDNTLIFFLSDNGATKEGGESMRLRSNLGNAPFRDYKSSSYEGGIASPLIMHWPNGIEAREGFVSGRPHISDILPTLLIACGVEYPPEWGLDPIPQLESVNILEDSEAGSRPLFFEHETTRAAIVGDWKLVSGGHDQPWELYHLPDDPFELKDLSKQKPEVVENLENHWQAWAVSHDVLPFEPLPWGERIRKYKK